ncbi:alpha/beta fold hydrolase [Amnibacterium kyonggiense]
MGDHEAAVPDRSLLPASFAYQRVDVGGVAINAAVGGSGTPLLLLHGYPQSHVMWRHVAPVLAERHTVVLADLRGYGDSDKPEPGHGDIAYSKRAAARDQVALMRRLGFERFQLIAHDRGARVAHRLVLDHPDVVSKLALLDIVPTRHVYSTVDRALATAYYHWFFLASGGGVSERLVGADPEFWVRSLIARLTGAGARIEEAALAEYVRAYSDPRTVRAGSADYRAGAGVDLEHDEETARRGQRIEVPTLVAWGEQSYVGRGYDTLDVWRRYAADVRGRSIAAGHFLAEERPEDVTALLAEWLDR